MTASRTARVTGADTVPAPVLAYFDAVNARDWDALAGLFAEDVEFCPVGSRDRRGRDDVVAYYPPLLAGFSEAHDAPVAFHVADDVVTVEISFTGRTSDGVPVAFDAADIFELRDGAITRLRLFYDTRDVARQVRAGGSTSGPRTVREDTP